MIQRGGRRDIFLGTRECMGYVEPCSYDEGVSYYQGTEIPYGFMYHGITYADEAEREERQGQTYRQILAACYERWGYKV